MVALRVRFLVLFTVLAFALAPLSAEAGGLCEASPGTAISIMMRGLATVYNVFPIKIAGVTIFNWSGLEDTGSVSSPICVCFTPFPRIGLTVSLWEPVRIIETVKVPYCFPALGVSIPLGINKRAVGTESDQQTEQDRVAFQQVHYYLFPLWSVFELFLDFVCLEHSGFDLAYMTEVDPLWQNDLLAFILNPEALIFGNPVTQVACMVDSVAAAKRFPLDPLFWCMGSWGSAYPLTGHVPSSDWVQANAGAAARMIYKLHRGGVLWGSVGTKALCGMYPMPIWRKSQYGLLLLYPVPDVLREPIGRTGLLWDWAKAVPTKDNFVWILYRKRDCCAF